MPKWLEFRRVLFRSPSRPRNTVAPAIFNSLQRFTIASYNGFPLYWSVSPRCRRRSLAFLIVCMRRLRGRAAVYEADHLHIGKDDESVLHHGFDLVDGLGQLLRRIHNRNQIACEGSVAGRLCTRRITSTSERTMSPSCIMDSISLMALANFSAVSTTEIMTGRSGEDGTRRPVEHRAG